MAVAHCLPCLTLNIDAPLSCAKQGDSGSAPTSDTLMEVERAAPKLLVYVDDPHLKVRLEGGSRVSWNGIMKNHVFLCMSSDACLSMHVFRCMSFDARLLMHVTS